MFWSIFCWALGGGGLYGTLRAITAPRALSMDLRLFTNGSGMESAGMWSVWDPVYTSEVRSSAFGYADPVEISQTNATGEFFTYAPAGAPTADGSPSLLVNLTSAKRAAEGCRNVIGGLDMRLGAINPGRQGGFGRLPSPLIAPVWGTVDCQKHEGDPSLVFTGVTAQYAPWPEDPNFMLHDVVIKAAVTIMPAAPRRSGLGQDEQGNLDAGNLAGSIHASLDVSSAASSVHSLPPLGGWATTMLNFWSTAGDLMRFQTSAFAINGVLDSRLGDPDRPYARIVAPVVTELPCVGVVHTVGSIFANIDGMFRLHADNVPMNISCGGGGEVDEQGERVADLVATAELALLIEPPEEFNRLVLAAQSRANEMINTANDAVRKYGAAMSNNSEAALEAGSGGAGAEAAGDGASDVARVATEMSNPLKYDGRFSIPFLKTINVKARHVRGPGGWYWDGSLDATIGGENSPLRLNANATFRTKEGFPPAAHLGVAITYQHESFHLLAAGSFPVGPCYDPFKFYGEIVIHPPASVVSNATFNISMTQYCQKDDGTTDYFFSAQISDWDIVPGTFGIAVGLIEGTLVRQGTAGEFKSWQVRFQGEVGILGASGGDLPDMGTGVLLSLKTVFGSNSDAFRLQLRAEFAIESKTDTSQFRLAGSAEFVSPCLLGERIGGLVNLTAAIGDMTIDGLLGSVYFYCHVNGTASPALEAELTAVGVVQFVKGVNLKEFSLAIQAYKSISSLGGDDGGSGLNASGGKITSGSGGGGVGGGGGGGGATLGKGDGEMWTFSGSVHGVVVLGGAGSSTQEGVAVDFVFNSRDGSWAAAVGYEIISQHVNMTLKGGTHGAGCTTEGWGRANVSRHFLVLVLVIVSPETKSIYASHCAPR